LDKKPDVSFLPPMFRRKLSYLNRMVFCTSNLLNKEEQLNNCPLIFSSRHGELDLSLQLVLSILEKNPMSPAGFSMSVHNSPVGLCSIHHDNQDATTAIAAGADSLKMAFIEAQSQLLDNPKALLCYVDRPMPDAYKCFADNTEYPQCFMAILERGSRGVQAPEPKGPLNFEDVIKHLLKEDNNGL
jgi:hypothetical protein